MKKIIFLLTILFLIACSGNDAKSEAQLISSYENQQNDVKKKKMAENECNNGNGKFCYFLAKQHEDGIAAPKDLSKAVDIYKKGCELGDSESCYKFTRGMVSLLLNRDYIYYTSLGEDLEKVLVDESTAINLEPIFEKACEISLKTLSSLDLKYFVDFYEEMSIIDSIWVENKLISVRDNSYRLRNEFIGNLDTCNGLDLIYFSLKKFDKMADLRLKGLEYNQFLLRGTAVSKVKATFSFPVYRKIMGYSYGIGGNSRSYATYSGLEDIYYHILNDKEKTKAILDAQCTKLDLKLAKPYINARCQIVNIAAKTSNAVDSQNISDCINEQFEELLSAHNAQCKNIGLWAEVAEEYEWAREYYEYACDNFGDNQTISNCKSLSRLYSDGKLSN